MIHVAAISPRGRQGDIDLGEAFELVDFLCSRAVDGLVLFSPAGEYAAFANEERARLVYLAVKRSRVPVIAGVGSASLDQSLELAREAREAGAAAVLLPPPYFFPYQQDDIREFYLQFASELGYGIPIYIANTPAFTSAIEPATALDLLGTGDFEGIEDATGWQPYHAAGYQVLAGDASGETAMAMPVPVLSAAACAAPEVVVALDRALAAGCGDESARLSALYRELLGWLSPLPLPAILKVAASVRGLKSGPIAMPLSPEKQRRMDEFREWFPAWLKTVNAEIRPAAKRGRA